MIKSNIRKYLDEAKMTQRELAKKCGITETSISRYVSGERVPNISTCFKIAKALGAPIDKLYTDTTED